MEKNRTNILLRAIIPIIIALVIWFSPTPAGLSPKAWQVFAIFAGVIAGIITRPVPDMESVAVLCGLTAIGILGLASVSDIFSGYGSSTPWLMLAAILISIGFMKTGFATRIAYLLIRALGKHILGVAYALTFADFALSPAIPSTTGRSGGAILPVATGVMKAYGSEPLPSPTARRIGNYLSVTLPQIAMVTSGAFLTAMIANPLIVSYAKQILGVDLPWMTWAIGSLPIVILCLLAVPLVNLYIVKPELRRTPEAPIEAQRKLREMGPMSRAEKVCLFVYVLALALWATGQIHGIDATIIGFLAGILLIAGGALTWDDVLKHKGIWNAVFWLAGMLSLTNVLNKYGFFAWLAKNIVGALGGAPPITIFTILVIVEVFINYGFASLSAKTTATIPAFYGIIALLPLNRVGAALALAYAVNFGGVLTQYSGAVCPLWYGLGYLTIKDWWKSGVVVGIVITAILLGVGIPYWKMIGFL
jgi:DASS family divalent anion:Na+ symporter